MMCSYRAPGHEAGNLNLGKCTFNIRYKQNPYTKYYSLMDYDDMHIHPVN